MQPFRLQLTCTYTTEENLAYRARDKKIKRNLYFSERSCAYLNLKETWQLLITKSYLWYLHHDHIHSFFFMIHF